jgi:hypothetical protein
VRYVVEPRRGVAAVRNRILDEGGAHRIVVFIDDDETPGGDDWLVRLLHARERFAAQAVAGPVRTVVDGELDSWIVAGGFYDRAHRQGLVTGSSIARAATNNLLIDLPFVRSKGIRFDEAFGRSGGEDSLFTSQLHRAGARLVWCAEASVHDHLLAERQNREHALVRTRAMASAGVRVDVVLATGPLERLVVRVRALAAGTIRVVIGAGMLAIGASRRSERCDAHGRRVITRGLGGIEGALGRSHAVYGTGG